LNASARWRAVLGADNEAGGYAANREAVTRRVGSGRLSSGLLSLPTKGLSCPHVRTGRLSGESFCVVNDPDHRLLTKGSWRPGAVVKEVTDALKTRISEHPKPGTGNVWETASDHGRTGHISRRTLGATAWVGRLIPPSFLPGHENLRDG